MIQVDGTNVRPINCDVQVRYGTVLGRTTCARISLPSPSYIGFRFDATAVLFSNRITDDSKEQKKINGHVHGNRSETLNSNKVQFI